ncbi:MAG: hypothetical protein M8349_00555 [ANME-2 cluster archaeon]|nr:hypothetical protein [ANME-2 cluster archaeon]
MGTQNQFFKIIRRDFPSAWADYINKSARHAGLTYGIDYTLTSDASSVTFTITGVSEEIQWYVLKTIITARMGMAGV